jgi:PQQ-dependent catabolism-associated beta-propeller protein
VIVRRVVVCDIARPHAHQAFQWLGQPFVAGAAFAPAFGMHRFPFCRATPMLGVVLVLAGAPTTAFAQTAHATAAAPRRIVVSNERSHDLTVLDGATLATVATIPVPGRARGVRITPDGRYALVALSDDRPQTPGPNDAIAEVDLTTHRVVRRLSAGTDPEQFAITPDGKRIVAANEDAGNASIIDPASGKVLASLVVGTEPEGVTVSPDGRWVYVTAETSNTISVIDMRSEKVVATFLVDARPRAVAFSPDGRFAWSTSEVGGTVARIDARRHRVLARMRIGTGEEKPVGVAVSPDARWVYVALGAGHALVKLDATTLREVGRVAIGRRPWGVALSHDGSVAYTANGVTDDVSVVDTRAMRVTRTVKVGTRPWGVAVVP